MRALGPQVMFPREPQFGKEEWMPEQTDQQPPDVMQLWRDWLTQTERQFNALFKEVMGTEAFGRSVGGSTEAYAAFHRLVTDSMERYLSFMNLPSRNEIVGLGETLRSIEDRLTHIEETLQIAADAVDHHSNNHPPAREPARTRRPQGVPAKDELLSEPAIPQELRRQ